MSSKKKKWKLFVEKWKVNYFCWNIFSTYRPANDVICEVDHFFLIGRSETFLIFFPQMFQSKIKDVHVFVNSVMECYNENNISHKDKTHLSVLFFNVTLCMFVRQFFLNFILGAKFKKNCNSFWKCNLVPLQLLFCLE
jgi:hypothetical protein